eukprot:Colp12_sorted_trinity150504_noHs@20677
MTKKSKERGISKRTSIDALHDVDVLTNNSETFIQTTTSKRTRTDDDMDSDTHPDDKPGSLKRQRNMLEQERASNVLSTGLEWLENFPHLPAEGQNEFLTRLVTRCSHTQLLFLDVAIRPHLQRDIISFLPEELAIHVLSYLDPRSLGRAAQVCKAWNRVLGDNSSWRKVCFSHRIYEPLPYSNDPELKQGRLNWRKVAIQRAIIDNNFRGGRYHHKVLETNPFNVLTCLQLGGGRIVAGFDDGTLQVWDLHSGSLLHSLQGHVGGVWSCQYENDIIVSGSTDRSIRVWNAVSGESVHHLTGHVSTVRCLHLRGNVIVSGSRDTTLRVWDLETGNCKHTLTGHTAAVRCVQADDRRIVSGSYDLTVCVWDLKTGQCLHTLVGHEQQIYSLQFDGTTIVSGALDKTIRVWNVETGQQTFLLEGHDSLVGLLQLQGSSLVSGASDGTLRVWDIKTGRCLHVLRGHKGAVTCLQFDNDRIVSGRDDGTMKLW